MQLTIATQDDKVVSLDVDDSTTVDDLKALLEVETGILTAAQQLLHHGSPVPASSTLRAAGVSNGDLLMLLRADQPAAPAGGGASVAMGPDGLPRDPHAFVRALRDNAQLMAQLNTTNPQLAAAVRNSNVEAVLALMRTANDAQRRAEEERQRQIDLLNADPFSAEAQARIEEQIQQAAVQESYENALEHTPEVFGTVIMLYVDMTVNGHPLKAFIDSGAQTTIMSRSCAQRCGLLRLMDKRFHGIASGVGTGKILGRVHQAPLRVGDAFISASITVLEQDGMEFLFGLDMLKRHQCVIDLAAGHLRFGSCSVTLPFLAEHELPLHLRPHTAQEAGDDAAALAGTGPAAEAASGMGPPPGMSAGAAAAGAAAARAAGGSHPPSSSTSAATPQAEALPAAAAAPAAASADVEAKVQRLMALGFGRPAVLQALQVCDGNEEQAASLLFEDGMGM